MGFDQFSNPPCTVDHPRNDETNNTSSQLFFLSRSSFSWLIFQPVMMLLPGLFSPVLLGGRRMFETLRYLETWDPK